ncbi:hypothetical protein BS78_06G169600 [Paspalum vaginatum]|nr:hypothetical protein BS78_06G169600 [Paspalum vaginatum]
MSVQAYRRPNTHAGCDTHRSRTLQQQQPAVPWANIRSDQAITSTSQRRRLLAVVKERGGRAAFRKQRHGHHPAAAFLGRQEPRVAGHVGLHVPGVHAVDAQRRVPPRRDPRVRVHGRLRHLVRRELRGPPARRPPSRSSVRRSTSLSSSLLKNCTRIHSSAGMFRQQTKSWFRVTDVLL